MGYSLKTFFSSPMPCLYSSADDVARSKQDIVSRTAGRSPPTDDSSSGAASRLDQSAGRAGCDYMLGRQKPSLPINWSWYLSECCSSLIDPPHCCFLIPPIQLHCSSLCLFPCRSEKGINFFRVERNNYGSNSD